MHDIATPMPTATMHALSPTFPRFHISPSQSSLSHFATRLPPQPSSNATLGIESHAQEEDCVGTTRRHAETIHGLVYVYRRSTPPHRLLHSHHHPRHLPPIQPPSLTLKPLPPCSSRFARCRLPRATIPSSSTIAVCPTHRTMPSLTRIVSRPYFHELARSQ
ncbi:hypothetical protein B0H14DRAFT_2823519, partial [Mycena olivaceomarginata]